MWAVPKYKHCCMYFRRNLGLDSWVFLYLIMALMYILIDLFFYAIEGHSHFTISNCDLSMMDFKCRASLLTQCHDFAH